MEAAPPSYAKATQVNYWDIIARYIPSDDLCSAALVSRRWHGTFAPHLWGNPASHFGIENDAVYVALTRFKRTLRNARLQVRSLTHTLHLPPAHTELYNGPHADWLRDILDRLPNLQSLIVRGLPFFDHAALQALRYKPPKEEDGSLPAGVVELPGSSGIGFQQPLDFTPSFGLRFLDASRCPNVTSGGLAQALKRFEGLLYLDLSFTLPARDTVVLKTLHRFRGLQVLKLRGIHLTDDALGILAPAIARRVRSLDVRDNHITDRGVRTLLDECFVYELDGGTSGSRSPGLLPYMGSEMLEIYQGEDFESYLRSMFTQSFVGRLAIEDAPEGGITHLYISNNGLSVEGVSGLIRSGRLHVLDVEGVMTGLFGSPSKGVFNDDDDGVSMPGVEKLIPVLFRHGSASMTFLRIDHALVTKDTTDLHPDEVIPGRVELDDTALPTYHNNAVELDGTSVQPDRVELPEVATPRYELEANPMDSAIPIAPPPPPEDEDLTQPNGFRRGSAIAPEHVESLSSEIQHMDLVSPVSPREDGTGTMTSTSSLLSPLPADQPNSLLSPNLANPTPGLRPRSYSSVADERRARLNAHTSSKHNLHPAMLPHLRTLILTNVPIITSTIDTYSRLSTFITQCGQESYLARSHAKLDYSLPPGRREHAAALKQSATKVFALQRLVLEMVPDRTSQNRRSSRASPWQNSTTTKSVTEDRDSESLWSAAETDFSFFGEEEVVLPTLEYGRFAHGSSNGNASQDRRLSSPPPQQNAPPPPVGPMTVPLLAAFRKDRKAAHEASVAAVASAVGTEEPETPGYWEGEIQVVWPWTAEQRKDEEGDYYGNRFQKSKG